MSTVTARTSRSKQLVNQRVATMADTILSPTTDALQPNLSEPPSHEPSRDATPDHSSSPDVHRAYSPLSDVPVDPNNPRTGSRGLSDDGSSALTDIDDQSDGRLTSIDDEKSDLDSVSDNETEAETERLHISPQKLRQSVEHLSDRDALASEIADETVSGELIAQDVLAEEADEEGEEVEEEVGEDNDEVEDEIEDIKGDDIPTFPPPVAGRKRKRNGQPSPPSGRLTLSDEPARKRTAPMTRRSFGIQSAPPPLPDPDLQNEDEDEEALSSDEEVALVAEEEDAKQNSSPEAPEAQDELQEALEEEVEAVVDNEDDLAETTPKEEADERRGRAFESFKPIESLFAIFRDKVFNERWEELSAELSSLKEDDTTHSDYLAMRRSVDARRDEKLRVEQVYLKYNIENLQRRTLATRAQIHAQCYQKIRHIREACLAELNEDFCQIQRERRHFKLRDYQPVYRFEPNRAKQIEHQTKYNKEVSLLSGIAKYRGFPAAPDIQSASSHELEEDLKAMNIQPAPRQVPFTAQLTNSERAASAAAEQRFLEQTVWANPNHPMIKNARMTDANAPILPIATPAGASQPWTMPASDARPQFGSGGIGKTPLSDSTLNGSSPFDQMKRHEGPHRSSQSTPAPAQFSHTNKPLLTGKSITKANQSTGSTSLQRTLSTPGDIHGNGTDRSSEPFNSTPFNTRPKASTPPPAPPSTEHRSRDKPRNSNNNINGPSVDAVARVALQRNNSATDTSKPSIFNTEGDADITGQNHQRFQTSTNPSSTPIKDARFSTGPGPGNGTPEKMASSVGVR